MNLYIKPTKKKPAPQPEKVVPAPQAAPAVVPVPVVVGLPETPIEQDPNMIAYRMRKGQ